MPPSTKQSLINTILALVTLIAMLGGGMWAVHKYLAPIENLPTAMTEVKKTLQGQSNELDHLAKTQMVQTQALQTLAEVAKDTKDMRRDVDKHTYQIEVIQEKLKQLEQ